MAGGILKNDQNYDHVGADEPQNMQGFGEKAVRRAFIRKVCFTQPRPSNLL